MSTRIKLFVLLVLLLLTPVSGFPASDRVSWIPWRVDLQPPIETVLTWDGQPGLNRTTTLTAQITPDVDVDHLTLHWVLPPGVTLSGSITESLGTVSAGQTAKSQRDLAFDQAGTFKVAVSAQASTSDPPAIWSDADVLFFSIHPGWGSHVSRRSPETPSTQVRVDTPNVRYSTIRQSASPQGSYQVTGRVMFEDIPMAPGACPQPAQLVPARQVLVEIWEEDKGLPDDHDGTTRTDDNGYFSWQVPDNDDGLTDTDGKETYLRIFPDTPGGYVTDRGIVDDRYYIETGIHQGGQNIDFGTIEASTLSPMFNISDALLDGYRYISQFRDPPTRVKVRYEPGKESQSHYNMVVERINLCGKADDPDAYDDSVILHEYGHFIADKYACDDSFGGEHNWYKHYSKRLAWSEGWANYLPSAVRSTSHYFDMNGAGSCTDIDWETWTVTGSTNEGAVCATLWDIHDTITETHDRLSLGGEYIWLTFQNWMGDSVPVSWTDCNVDAFWDGWLEAGYPDDSELAAIFAHHHTAGLYTTTQTNQHVVAASPSPTDVPTARGDAPHDPDSRAHPTSIASANAITWGGLPWNATLFLVDATASMGGEISTVRQIIQNQVSDMDAGPDPYEYTVETFRDDGTNDFVTDHFFPDVVNPLVAGITTGGGGDTAEDSFAALARGAAGRDGYNAWLLTDAAPKYDVSEAELEAVLQSREITPFFFIFGDCSDANLALSGADEEEMAPRPAAPGRLHLPSFSAADLASCIEPYLLVANSTNGQLLLIDTGQLIDAAEIVRALMGNNAGAGRYADYVSASHTYAWDDTEYYWYDVTGGTYWNVTDGCESVSLPSPFSFYGNSYSAVQVCGPGYVSFSDPNAVSDNNPIPSTAAPNNAIYAFWDDIRIPPYVPRAKAPTQIPRVYTNFVQNRFVIEYYQACHRDDCTKKETFETILHYGTGEVILQYAQVTDDSSATVGVENATGTIATQVIHNNPGALTVGRAIGFTPMPPQPTNDHEVVVDSTMGSVIFLLNGYSGAVDLTVYRPDWTPLDPADPGATFLEAGKVKYYRVSSPEVGTWTARASGEGTYYFTSSSSSSLAIEYLGDLTLGSGTAPIVVDLGTTVSTATFSLVNPNGSSFDNLELYDDGAHGDGQAADGRYGGSYPAPKISEAQTFYIQVDGQTATGEDFRRTDLTPIRFQRMELIAPWSTEQFAMPGDTVLYDFYLNNDTSKLQCFSLDLQSSYGWASVSTDTLCIGPTSGLPFQVTIEVPPGADNVVEQTILTAHTGEMGDSAVVATTVRGPATGIDLGAYPTRIPPDGYQALIVAQVEDDDQWSVADGTGVTFQTTLGTLNPSAGTTADGMVTTTLTSGVITGLARVQATVGGVTDVITVEITMAPAYTLTVEANPDRLPPDGTSTALLTAHVRDLYGGPAPDGTAIVFVVEGDDAVMGTVEGHEVYTATVSGGVVTATYQSGTTPGFARMRAVIPSASEGEGAEGQRWAKTTIWLGHFHDVYLPTVLRGGP